MKVAGMTIQLYMTLVRELLLMLQNSKGYGVDTHHTFLSYRDEAARVTCSTTRRHAPENKRYA
jgi:hypothetical protein